MVSLLKITQFETLLLMYSVNDVICNKVQPGRGLSFHNNSKKLHTLGVCFMQVNTKCRGRLYIFFTIAQSLTRTWRCIKRCSFLLIREKFQKFSKFFELKEECPQIPISSGSSPPNFNNFSTALMNVRKLQRSFSFTCLFLGKLQWFLLIEYFHFHPFHNRLQVRLSKTRISGGNSVREVGGGRSFANFRQICFDFS